MLTITSFPIILNNLNIKQITIGTGIFFGVQEIIPGILDVLF